MRATLHRPVGASSTTSRARQNSHWLLDIAVERSEPPNPTFVQLHRRKQLRQPSATVGSFGYRAVMPVSVEARAIRASERLADVYLSSAHIDDEAPDVESLVGRLLDVPYMSIISLDHLQLLFRELPHLPRTWEWDQTPQMLVARFLRTLALGHFSDVGTTTPWDFFSPFPLFHPAFLEELFHWQRRGNGASNLLGPVRGKLALDLVMRLAAPEGDLDSVRRDGLEHLFEHEVPFSHSPGLGGLTLKDIADKARYIVLLPLAAGASHAVEAVYRGEWTAAILTAASSGGATLIFAGTLWIADRVFRGVRQLDAGRHQKQLPQPAPIPDAPKGAPRKPKSK